MYNHNHTSFLLYLLITLGWYSDGFALNVGREDWQILQTEKCFDALRRYRSGRVQGQGSEKREFKLFFSFDMSWVKIFPSLSDTETKLVSTFFWALTPVSSIPSSCPEDINHLKTYIEKFATSEYYIHYEGRALISTFAGETSLFGCEDIDSAWCLVRGEIEEICPVRFPPFSLCPSFHVGRALHGHFHWL